MFVIVQHVGRAITAAILRADVAFILMMMRRKTDSRFSEEKAKELLEGIFRVDATLEKACCGRGMRYELMREDNEYKLNLWCNDVEEIALIEKSLRDLSCTIMFSSLVVGFTLENPFRLDTKAKHFKQIDENGMIYYRLYSLESAKAIIKKMGCPNQEKGWVMYWHVHFLRVEK